MAIKNKFTTATSYSYLYIISSIDTFTHPF